MSSNSGDHQETVVIIGGNQGIGLATVELMLRKTKNRNIISSYRSCDKNLHLLKQKHGKRLEIIKLDLSQNESIENFCASLSALASQISGVVLCSGVISTESCLRTTAEELSNHFHINCISQLVLLQYIIRKHMLKTGGAIVAISSSAVTNLNGGRMAYSASKSALETALLTMANELISRKIRINIIRPGLTDTRLMRDSTSQIDIDNYIKKFGSIPKPDEISGNIFHLLSDSSQYVNSQVITVDGGRKF